MIQHPERESVLIVDDTPANLRLLSQILSQHNYKVRAVINGQRALDAVQLKPPDLILLDIMMPHMDGYEVCRELKADGQTAYIPIIFISALDETIDKVKAFSIGGVDYITKPFQTEEVLARVQTHLSLKRLRQELETVNEQLTQRNAELETRNAELEQALSTIKTLSGLVPICAWCGRKIQSEQGEWIQVESYIESHTEAEFTHGICPDCLEKLKTSS